MGSQRECWEQWIEIDIRLFPKKESGVKEGVLAATKFLSISFNERECRKWKGVLGAKKKMILVCFHKMENGIGGGVLGATKV